jgi:hypothetical protein
VVDSEVLNPCTDVIMQAAETLRMAASDLVLFARPRDEPLRHDFGTGVMISGLSIAAARFELVPETGMVQLVEAATVTALPALELAVTTASLPGNSHPSATLYAGHGESSGTAPVSPMASPLLTAARRLPSDTARTSFHGDTSRLSAAVAEPPRHSLAALATRLLPAQSPGRNPSHRSGVHTPTSPLGTVVEPVMPHITMTARTHATGPALLPIVLRSALPVEFWYESGDRCMWLTDCRILRGSIPVCFSDQVL